MGIKNKLKRKTKDRTRKVKTLKKRKRRGKKGNGEVKRRGVLNEGTGLNVVCCGVEMIKVHHRDGLEE